MGGATSTRLLCVGFGVTSFNRRGDSLGGATIIGRYRVAILECFNRRGDSLGGATLLPFATEVRGSGFNRRGDSLGGATSYRLRVITHWNLFQSQRRFFGGSNKTLTIPTLLLSTVSIAEAILWGEQLNGFFERHGAKIVSIAEAILWGEQRYCRHA